MNNNIVLFRKKELQSFLLFIRAEHSTRMPFLRELSLWCGPLPAELSSALKDLFLELGPLGKLRCLTIDFSETLLSSDPELANAVASLSSLSYLSLCQAKAASCDTLENIKSSLESVDIRLIEAWERLSSDESDYDENISRNGYDKAVDVVGHLHRFRDTLNDIKLVFPLRSAPDWPVFPRVKRLELDSFYAPVTLHYVQAFPNLVHIVLSEMDDFWDVCDEFFDEYRQCNMEQQAQYRDAWPALKIFEGSFHALYILALPIHVPRVKIKCIPRSYLDDDSVELAWLDTMLADVRPSHLEVEVKCVKQFVLSKAFRTALTTERDHPLKSLGLVLRLSEFDKGLKPDVLMVCLSFPAVFSYAMWTNHAAALDVDLERAPRDHTLPPFVVSVFSLYRLRRPGRSALLAYGRSGGGPCYEAPLQAPRAWLQV